MGPAKDMTGFKQSGVNSSDFNKFYNNEQLLTAQQSHLGANIGSSVISAIGQADDRMLVSLTEYYCSKFRVHLEPAKTKLLWFSSPKQSFLVDHSLNTKKITINQRPVELVSEAEHVGVLRSSSGNLPHLVHRVAMYKSALHSLLPAGLAIKHRGNPAASLKLGQIYGASNIRINWITSCVKFSSNKGSSECGQ